MEYHHQTDDEDTFCRWWREEGREAQYYQKREELDRLSFLARSDSSHNISGIVKETAGVSSALSGTSTGITTGKGKISYKNL